MCTKHGSPRRVRGRDPVWKNWTDCSEATLTGESRFHISAPLEIWTWFPHDGEQTGNPLDQWDMVWMWRDCRLCTGLPPSNNSVGCEAGRRTCSDRETGTEELCEIRSVYTLSARNLAKHPLKGDEAAGLHIVSAETSEAPTEGRRNQWSNHVRVTNVARQC
jgi:hypothetical protein